MKHRIIGRLSWSLFIVCVIMLRVVVNLSSGHCLDRIFWFIDFSNETHVLFSYLNILLPQLLLLILLGDYFTENIYNNASVLVTRANGVKKITGLFSFKLLFFGTFLCTILLLGTGLCQQVTTYVDKNDIINCILYVLFMINFLLFVNYMSIFGSPIFGTGIGIALQIIGLQTKTILGYYYYLLNDSFSKEKVLYGCLLFLQIIVLNVIFRVLFKRKEWR